MSVEREEIENEETEEKKLEEWKQKEKIEDGKWGGRGGQG